MARVRFGVPGSVILRDGIAKGFVVNLAVAEQNGLGFGMIMVETYLI